MKFFVKVYEVHSYVVEVEAADATAAREKVERDDYTMESGTEFEHTVDSCDWLVEDEDGNIYDENGKIA